MEERIDEILEMYNNCFEELNGLPACPETSVVEIYINPELIKDSLIAMDRKIYRQKENVKDL